MTERPGDELDDVAIAEVLGMEAEVDDDGEAGVDLKTFGQRLEEAGLPIEWGEYREVVKVGFPNGRSTRWVEFAQRRVRKSNEVPIHRIKFLGDYLAIWDPETGTIEARLRAMAEARIWRAVPGIAVETSPDVWEERTRQWRMEARGAPFNNYKWRVRTEHNGTVVEVSTTSELSHLATQTGTRARGASLKLIGVNPSTHDEALAALEDLGNAFLFELDLRYNVAAELLREPRRHLRRLGPRVDQPPQFPRNRYSDEAVGLYQYGRSALGLPLLQFLAFYQVLEFFFPVFSREEGIRQLRNRLQDPLLDLGDDVALGKLLGSLSQSRPDSEREQLRVALRRCLEDTDIRDFIENDQSRLDHFCSNKQTIRGATKVSLSTGGTDLRDQTADRIYAIRCRIVHMKQDGGPGAVDLLLPSSREVRSLGADVDLVQFAAQRAIVAAAGRRP